MARERSFSGIALSLLVGTVLAFVVLEGGLRLVGLFLSRPAARDGGEDVTLLAVGDSFTYGIGGDSFPDQLEQLLDDRHDLDFRVVNAGVPGYSSAHVVDSLPAQLERWKPDVVLVTLGENNKWNTVRLADAGGLTLGQRLDRFLLHSRVYKFIKVAAIGWSNNRFHQWADEGGTERAANLLLDPEEPIGLVAAGAEEGVASLDPAARDAFLAGVRAQEAADYEAAIEHFRGLVASDPSVVEAWVALGSSWLRLDRPDEAIAAFERGHEAVAARAGTADPAAEEVVHDLSLIHGYALLEEGRVDDAVDVWSAGLRRLPSDGALYRAITEARFAATGDLWSGVDLVADLPGIEDNELHQHLMALRASAGAEQGSSDLDRLVDRGLERDLERIAAMAERHGARVVFSSYPLHAYEPVPRVAASVDAPYIDFRPIFDTLFESEDDFIAADRCHCNTVGYHVMAAAFAVEVERVLELADGPSPEQAAREALEAFRAEGRTSLQRDPELERPRDAKSIADDRIVMEHCQPVVLRLQARGGATLSDRIGHRLRNRLPPAEIIEVCDRVAAIDDESEMLDALAAELELDRSEL